MRLSGRAIAAVVCAVLAAAGAALARQAASPGAADVRLHRILGSAEARAVEYFQLFKDLTAEETKTVEEVRASGEVSRRRRIVSDLIVYRSVLDNGSITEYRDVREVDGRPVAGRQERVLALFSKQSEAKSVRDELARVNKEGSRYDLDYTVSGLTIAQGLPLQPWARALFDFSVEGEERVGGRATVRLAYEQAVPNSRFGFNFSLPSELRRLPPLYRGRLWIDAETAQLLREERDVVLRPPGGPPLLLQRAEFVYEPSRFGISLPKRIVFGSYLRFEKTESGAPATSLRYRLTFEYGPFTRFTAEGEQAEIARVLEDDEPVPADAVPESAPEEAAPGAARENAAAEPAPDAVPEPDVSLGPEFGPDAPTGPPVEPDPPVQPAPAETPAIAEPTRPVATRAEPPASRPEPAAPRVERVTPRPAPAAPRVERVTPRPAPPAIAAAPAPPPSEASRAPLELAAPGAANAAPSIRPSAPPPRPARRAAARPPRLAIPFLALPAPRPATIAPPAPRRVPRLAPAPPAPPTLEPAPPRFRRPPPS